MTIDVFSSGVLELAGKKYRCSLGRGGVAEKQSEGDGITPVGNYPLRQIYYRADRIAPPTTKLPLTPIGSDDGWCDDPKSPDYNRLIKLPSQYSHEKLWRGNNLYDIVVPIGYNDDPAVAGKGSAIFVHIAQPDYSPTEGCVALSRPDLLEVLEKVGLETQIHIHADQA
jgi:L,D-peptidoglycan transpeptidase YkuD (ErfK/YbiS/YcfS/YnhG family)